MEPRDPLYRDRVERSMQCPVTTDFFRFYPVRIEPNDVQLAVDLRPELGHAPGWFEGMVVAAIAEMASALAVVSMLAADSENIVLDQHVSFLGSAKGERLIAKGRTLTAGRTVATAAADVFVLRDGEEHLCATMLQTNRISSAGSA